MDKGFWVPPNSLRVKILYGVLLLQIIMVSGVIIKVCKESPGMEGKEKIIAEIDMVIISQEKLLKSSQELIGLGVQVLYPDMIENEIQVDKESLEKLAQVFETALIEKEFKIDAGISKRYNTEGSLMYNGTTFYAIYFK